MGLIDDVLKQYAGGSTQVPTNVSDHFDQVAEAAPKSSIADGIAAAFRSDQTSTFGQMLGSLFSQSSGEQKAGMLNQLLPSLGPGVFSQVARGGLLAGLLGRAGLSRSLPSKRSRFRRKWYSSWPLMPRNLTLLLLTKRALSTHSIPRL